MNFLKLFRDLPAQLTRVTSGGKFIKEIDGLRFLAIFPVVIQHLSERFERHTRVNFFEDPTFESFAFFTNRGFIGVYIFFVISGFILSLPFANYYLQGGRKISIRNYFWRRLTRLEPPYIIAISAISLGLIISGYYSLEHLLPHYFATITYLHSIIYHEWSFINPPVWTLEIEVQFYILAPALATLFFSIRHLVYRRMVLVSAILLILFLQDYFRIPHQYTNLTILGHLHFFLIGFLMTDIFLMEWQTEIRRNWWFDWLAVAAFLSLIFSWSWDYELLNRTVFAAALFVLFYAAFRATWLNTFLRTPWITAIGGMCYTIYLIHLPLTEVFIRLTKGIVVTNIFAINFFVQFLLLIPFVLIPSIIFYLMVEKPCMYKDWPQRFGGFVKETFRYILP